MDFTPDYSLCSPERVSHTEEESVVCRNKCTSAVVIDIAETIAGECCKVYSVGRDQYVASLFLCVDDVAASKVIYEMMECSVEDVVLNLLCKIRVQAVKDWFYIVVVIIYHIQIYIDDVRWFSSLCVSSCLRIVRRKCLDFIQLI